VRTHLIKVERRSHFRIQPNRVPRTLSKLLSARRRQQREGDTESRIIDFLSLLSLPKFRSSNHIDPTDDVAELVRTAELNCTVVEAMKGKEVVGLEQLIGEFGE